MSFDPDFIIEINGEDVTRYIYEWKLDDNEKKSTLEVTLKNWEQILSDKFDIGQSISIIFGYIGNQGEKVEMTIKKIEESYSVEDTHDYIKVIGYHALDDLEGSSGGTGGQTPVDFSR